MPQSKMYIVWNLYMYIELNDEQWLPMMLNKICEQRKLGQPNKKRADEFLNQVCLHNMSNSTLFLISSSTKTKLKTKVLILFK